ncbi:MAG: glycosyltransferase family 2 protein [Mesorhizobium sp.]|uniref:glycosyltransferase family 2 protein n=1 Tax=Mesorhizobium sp. TaxID=1871066 RepID=UPI001ACBA4C1|nr:glycosyltransferase family A protein [Mesorhizobium sp.]MBN9221033.1 glycosyltransferase family 2 protein [Mesorhizobium sp.]
MKLSVIMPVYNRETYVVSALRSLLRQRDAADLDIIVVDDGSTDGSVDAVRFMMQGASCIRLFEQANEGVARARNAGLRQMPPQTQFVSFLDSDDISPAGRFKTDLAFFEADPTLELTYSLMTKVDVMDDQTLQPAPGGSSGTVRGVSLSAAIFRRALVDRTGFFDEDLKQGEDTDYLLRVFETAPRHVLADTVAVYYRRHTGNLTKETEVAVRAYLHVIQKSMRRRKADPSLRPVEGLFEIRNGANG